MLDCVELLLEKFLLFLFWPDLADFKAKRNLLDLVGKW